MKRSKGNAGKRFAGLALASLMSVSMTVSMSVSAFAAETTESAAALSEGDFYTLTVLHTNDFHGNVDRLPYYATIIDQVRAEAKNLLVIDSGDVFLRGEFESYTGEVELNIMNEMGYDLMVPGNNDFRVPNGGTIEDGNSQLALFNEVADFPILCANVTYLEGGEYAEGIEPYIVMDVNGVDVALLGVTSMKPEVREWTEVSDKDFVSAEIVVSEMIEEVSEKSDVCVVVSHAGLAVDTMISDIAGVSAVLGADDHFKIPTPIHKNFGGLKGTPITQAGGETDHYLGRIDLVFQMTEGEMKLVDFDGFLYDLETVAADADVQAIIDSYRK